MARTLSHKFNNRIGVEKIYETVWQYAKNSKSLGLSREMALKILKM